jgi:hypothetical protein
MGKLGKTPGWLSQNSKQIYLCITRSSPIAPYRSNSTDQCILYRRRTNMIKKQTIESQLNCKATAELNDSVIDDMLKADGNLKELLDESNDQSETNEHSVDRDIEKMH